MERKLNLKLLSDEFAIVKLSLSKKIPEWLLETNLYSITRTEKERTVVCSVSCIPTDYQFNNKWKCLKVEGSFGFDEVGIISSISKPLSEIGISIYVFSSYDTDYILVQKKNVDTAIKVLDHKGHSILY